MSWADAKPALTTGAVDGQENPLSIFSIAKVYEVGQKHLTLWHYVADPLIFAVNQDVWKSFTPEDREIVQQAALDAGAEGIALARKGLTGGDRSAIAEVERSEEHTSELQSLMRISYAVFCLKKKKKRK